MEIKRDADGKLIAAPAASNQMITIRTDADGFTIDESTEISNGFSQSSEKKFRPSTTAGDWDLVENTMTTSMGGNRSQSRLTRPIASYLHKADPSVREYYEILDAIPLQIADREAIYDQLLGKAQQYVQNSPDDIYIRVLLLDALQRSRDADEFEAEFARDEKLLRNSGNICLNIAADFAARNLKILQAERAGLNAWPQLTANIDLAAQWNAMLLLPDNFVFLNPNISFIARETVPNFLGLQTFVKVMRTEAVFAMLSGRPDDAFKVFYGLIRIGQELTQDGTLINRLIGIAFRSIGVSGMSFYVLNVSDSAADLDRAWPVLEKLEADYRSPGEADLFNLNSLEKMYEGAYKPNMIEAVTRAKVSDAQFEILRVATAARARMLATGSFPMQPDQFAPYFAQSLPADPFTSASLMMISGSEKLTAYSAGPDRDDDRAAVSYDPTNGTTSDGDVFLEVPRRRQYPIPPGGLQGKTAQQIQRQMPNGLPPDVFASTKGRPLNIGQTRPITIFSWGPDIDEKVGPNGILATKDIRTVPEIHYDPTNGTNSEGDLILKLR